MNDDIVILGIDPGTTIMGYGLIRVSSNKPQLIDMGILSLAKEKDPFVKLSTIFGFITRLIKEHGVSEMAIEAPFYGENVQSMIKLGRAQGVSIAAGLNGGVSITEYAPRSIKMAITGRGNSSKEQVAGLLQHLLNFKGIPSKLDATDGLAIALCHFYNRKKINSEKSFKSWNDFLTKNPDRIKK